MEFRDNGFEATSVDKVAARAEVSKRTLYNHFPSKDELFAAILHILWENSAKASCRGPTRPALPARNWPALVQGKLAMLADDNFLALARVAIAGACICCSGTRHGGAFRREGRRDRRRTAPRRRPARSSAHAAQAYKQLECLVKGVAFWPQVAMGQPRLAPAAQKKLAAATVDRVPGPRRRVAAPRRRAGGPARRGQRRHARVVRRVRRLRPARTLGERVDVLRAALALGARDQGRIAVAAAGQEAVDGDAVARRLQHDARVDDGLASRPVTTGGTARSTGVQSTSTTCAPRSPWRATSTRAAGRRQLQRAFGQRVGAVVELLFQQGLELRSTR